MSAVKALISFPLEETEMKEKQGIVAILGEEKRRNGASIRRTLSADMSSKSWLLGNGFFSLVKRNPNSYASDSSSSSESEEEWERSPSVEDVWKNIVRVGKPDKTEDCSSMILIKQKSESSVLPPPYVHPMVRRSAMYMSEKSLQMCTEPLGSETGADCCLSCYSCSRVFNGDGSDRERVAGGKQRSHFVNKKSPVPPPLTSASGADGTTLCIQSRRENGRLVMEAVSQAPRNRFITQRRDGRLVLTLARPVPTASAVEEDDYQNDGSVEEKKGATFVVSGNLNTLPSGIHKLVVKRLVTIGNENPKLVTEADHKNLPSPTRMAPLLIPQPPSRSPSFNAYEYFWRSKSAAPTTLKRSFNNISAGKWNQNRESVANKGNREDCFLPYMKKGCRETRTILFWESDCIPTW